MAQPDTAQELNELRRRMQRLTDSAANAERDATQLSAAMLDLTVRAGVGGRETVRPLRQLVANLPIITASAYSDDPVMAEPAQFGFTASLHKPFRLSELGDLLARLVTR